MAFDTQYQQQYTPMSAFVNTKQSFYTPPENVSEIINKHSAVLANGAIGIDFVNLAPPNIKRSEVLRMLEQEEEYQQSTAKGERTIRRPKIRPPINWPPKSEVKHASSFFIRAEGLKRVSWPPPPPDTQPIHNSDMQQGQSDAAYLHNSGYDGFNNEHLINNPNSTNYSNPPTSRDNQLDGHYSPTKPPHQLPPTNVTLLETAPVRQAPPPVYSAQPVIKRQVPARMRGDLKWPPESWKQLKATENAPKGPVIRPRREQRDYSNFFAQNALKPSYPGYHVPPGTQHYYDLELGQTDL